jgi:hypothetical protein
MALVAIAEVGTDVGWPLVGFGQYEPVVIVGVDGCANLFDSGVGLRKVFAAGAVAFDEIGDCVHAECIDAHVEPESHGLDHLFDNNGVVEVQIGLVGKEAMPVERLRDLVPCPVGLFGVGEDDASVFEELVGLRPHIELAFGRAGRCVARGLKPRVLIAGVVDDQLDHHLHAAQVSGVENLFEIVQRAIAGVDVDVIGDVVAIIAQRRREEWQQPDAGDAEVLQIIELGQQSRKITDAVCVRVHECADVEFVNYRVFVPKRICGASGFFHSLSSSSFDYAFVSVPAALSLVSPFRGRTRRKICAGMTSGRSAT